MAAGQAELNMKPGDTSYADVLERVGWASGKASNPLGGYRGPKSGDILDAIHVGDRVTVVNRFGQERTGRAVMRGLHGWVLNMGGAHGTPKVADNENIVRVSGRHGGNKTVMEVEGGRQKLNPEADYDASDIGKVAWRAWMRREPFEGQIGNWGGLANHHLNIKIEPDYRGGPESLQLWVTTVEGRYVVERERITGRMPEDQRKVLKLVSSFIATGYMKPTGRVEGATQNPRGGSDFDVHYGSPEFSAVAKRMMHRAQTSDSLRMLMDVWEWAGQNNEGGDVWVPGEEKGIIVTIGERLRKAGKSFDDLLRFEQKRNPGKYVGQVYFSHDRLDVEALQEHLEKGHGIPTMVLSRKDKYDRLYWILEVPQEDMDRAVRARNDWFDEARRGRRNPEPDAAAMYETFHGTPSTEVIEVEEDFHYHSNLAVLGTATELIVKVRRRGNMKISFDGHTKLCSNEEGTQLYLIDGDQSLNLRDIGIKRSRKGPHGDVTDVKDKILVGEIIELTYRTKKSFDNFKLTDYYHGLGEDSGVRPSLVYDVLNKHLEIVGGQYKVHDVGIVN